MSDLHILILCYCEQVESVIQIYTATSNIKVYLPPSVQPVARFRRQVELCRRFRGISCLHHQGSDQEGSRFL